MVYFHISSMIGNLFYLCPTCLTEDSLFQKRDLIYCQKCPGSISFKNNRIYYKKKDYSVSEFYHLIRSSLSLSQNKSDKYFRISKRARLRQGLKKISYRGRDGFISTIEAPVEVDSGHLVITKEALIFKGKVQQWVFPKEQLTGYTTNSKYFEFKLREKPFYQIYFEEESPLKYEELLTEWMEINSLGLPMMEHQPKISYNLPKTPALVLSYNEIDNWGKKEKYSLTEFLLHVFIGRPIVQYLKWHSNLTFKNQNLIPKTGPFILLMNHESYLDPIIISTLLKRRIGFFTKSTSFANRILQPIFRAYRSLPNRRYEVDPQVVRQALRIIQRGNCIGIFPEGERTWDGNLLPFKYNTIKFLLSVQIPIVIVSIKGAFQVLPRWRHSLKTGQIKIEVQRSFSLIPNRWPIDELKKQLELYFRKI